MYAGLLAALTDHRRLGRVSRYQLQRLAHAHLPGCWVDCVNAVLVEAYFHAGIPSVSISIIAASVLLALMASVSLDLIPDVHYEARNTPRHSTVSIKDLMLNAMGTTFMLLARIIYRKHVALKQERSCTTPGLQITVVPVSAKTPASDWDAPKRRPRREMCTSGGRVDCNAAANELCFVKFQTAIDPQNVLVAVIARRTMTMKRWHAHLLHSIGLASLVLSALSFIAHMPHCVCIGALVTTLAFVGWFICCLHRKLLYLLLTSFDFVFLYLQLVAAHVCICELINWEWTRCCAVVAGHLWMLWALTLDALTPVLRRRLRLQMRLAITIVSICAFAKALLSIELLYWTHWRIQDSELVDLRVGKRRLQFHIQSFLLSRFLTILVWCSRLLWRMCTRRDANELVLLLGRVEYNYRAWRTQSRNWTLLTAIEDVPPVEPNQFALTR